MMFNKEKLRSDGKVADWIQRCVVASHDDDDDDDDVDDDDVDDDDVDDNVDDDGDNDDDMMICWCLFYCWWLMEDRWTQNMTILQRVMDGRTDKLVYWDAMDKSKKVEDNSETYY